MPPVIAVAGGGPAGLMAAEAAIQAGAIRAGAAVHVFDSMPSMGRKFLMAGKSGLNLTHAEPADRFMSRFGASRARLEPIVAAFGPDALRAWALDLGIETFIGSSGRVFPVDFKAAPLLRAWQRRLRAAGVIFHMRHRWIGWDKAGNPTFDTPEGVIPFPATALILALGGASWPKLGSDGEWVPLLKARGIAVNALKPANCGFEIAWSSHFRDRFAGEPVKPVLIMSETATSRGEIVITDHGIEGGGIYPYSAALREAIASRGTATIRLDLLPDHTPECVAQALLQPRGSRSLAEHLRRVLGLKGVKAGLLRESMSQDEMANSALLASRIKNLPLTLLAPRPIEEAISSAGGIAWDALNGDLMIEKLPGVFAAGEMLDWEVTTGGYLLTACLALGLAAGKGAARWIASHPDEVKSRGAEL